MEDCTNRISDDAWKVIKRLAAFRYTKEPVDTVADLYSKYPAGNDDGVFCFVKNENTFYRFYIRERIWAPIGGYTSFEVWVQQPGNEGKTEDDFLTWLKHEALEAAETANEAAANANAATEAANTATENANTATELANEAAGNANTAAETANTAAGNALEIANEAAEDALGIANAAAENANEAAEAANTAAERSNTLSDNPPKIQDNYWYFYNEASRLYVPSVYVAKGEKGESPRVSDHQTWEVYNYETEQWEDTGIDCSSDYELTKAKVEGVLTGHITTHDHVKVSEIRFSTKYAGNIFGEEYLKCDGSVVPALLYPNLKLERVGIVDFESIYVTSNYTVLYPIQDFIYKENNDFIWVLFKYPYNDDRQAVLLKCSPDKGAHGEVAIPEIWPGSASERYSSYNVYKINEYIFVAYYSQTLQKYLYAKSKDGIHWETFDIPYREIEMYTAFHLNGNYYFRINSKWHKTADFTTFEEVIFTLPDGFNTTFDIRYAGDCVFAQAANAAGKAFLAYSSDMETFTECNIDGEINLWNITPYAVGYNYCLKGHDGYYMTLPVNYTYTANKSIILKSTDRINWHLFKFYDGINVLFFVYDGFFYYLFGANHTVISPDLVNYNLINANSGNYATTGVATVGGNFVVFGPVYMMYAKSPMVKLPDMEGGWIKLYESGESTLGKGIVSDCVRINKWQEDSLRKLSFWNFNVYLSEVENARMVIAVPDNILTAAQSTLVTSTESATHGKCYMGMHGDVMHPNGSVLIPAGELNVINDTSKYGIESIMLFDTVYFRKNTWDNASGGNVTFEAINIRKGCFYNGNILIISDTYNSQSSSNYGFAIPLTIQAETGYFFFKEYSKGKFHIYLDSTSSDFANAQWLVYDNILGKLSLSKDTYGFFIPNTKYITVSSMTPHYADKVFDVYMYYSTFIARILKWEHIPFAVDHNLNTSSEHVRLFLEGEETVYIFFIDLYNVEDDDEIEVLKPALNTEADVDDSFFDSKTGGKIQMTAHPHVNGDMYSCHFALRSVKYGINILSKSIYIRAVNALSGTNTMEVNVPELDFTTRLPYKPISFTLTTSGNFPYIRNYIEYQDSEGGYVIANTSNLLHENNSIEFARNYTMYNRFSAKQNINGVLIFSDNGYEYGGIRLSVPLKVNALELSTIAYNARTYDFGRLTDSTHTYRLHVTKTDPSYTANADCHYQAQMSVRVLGGSVSTIIPDMTNIQSKNGNSLQLKPGNYSFDIDITVNASNITEQLITGEVVVDYIRVWEKNESGYYIDSYGIDLGSECERACFRGALGLQPESITPQNEVQTVPAYKRSAWITADVWGSLDEVEYSFAEEWVDEAWVPATSNVSFMNDNTEYDTREWWEYNGGTLILLFDRRSSFFDTERRFKFRVSTTTMQQDYILTFKANE
jgi:hypothetical protein